MTDDLVISPIPSSFASLLHDENHVWHINPEKIRDRILIEYCFSILSPEEKNKLSRFHFKKDRHQYLISHAFLRCVLSQYSNILPVDWRFSIGKYGRPRIANKELRQGLDFNLTHTVGLTVCVVSSEGRCGVDAEKIIAKNGLQSVAEQTYPSADCKQLERLLTKDNFLFLRYFYSQWVLREAYSKATGLGIVGISNDMIFSVKPDKSIVFQAAQDADENPKWHFQLIDLLPDYVVAVAFGDNSIRKNVIEYTFHSTNGRQCFERFQRGLLFSD